MNRLFSFLRLTHERENEVRRFLVLFYLIGFIGLVLPWTHPFFRYLIPLALMLSFIILLAYYPQKPDKKTAWVFVVIGTAGFIVEMAGVHTGKIFGAYRYGNSLGPLVVGVPPLIGLNWLLVSCLSAAVVVRYVKKPWVRIAAASALMTLYDWVLEPVAPKLGMWSFDGGLPALQNYLAWFITGWFFQWLLVKTRITVQNGIGVFLFIVQILFFLLIHLGGWVISLIGRYFF